jgi:cyclopropane-fatty-acyl-phospholipid synthase
LDAAEEAMLDLTCRRAEIRDGMDILELGCGWGALSLWIAEKFPHCNILAVSNSRPQADTIRSKARERGFSRMEVRTADMNSFSTEATYDRVVSVETFEHMRNWEALLGRISRWLKPHGKLFIHIFSHIAFPYRFEVEGADNWMGRMFFTGGIMPSDSLLLYLQRDLRVQRHWRLNGMHYARTLEAWLANMDRLRERLIPLLAGVYGHGAAQVWYQRWRMFMMACAELFAYGKGDQWMISHYLLTQRPASGSQAQPAQGEGRG